MIQTISKNKTINKTSMRLESFKTHLAAQKQSFIGFPATLDFDYSELQPLLQVFLNNIGDPNVDSWCGTHSKEFEREVIAFFANLFRAPKDNYWGYVTNGSTECNLYALYLARQKYPDATVYYSSSAHYSVPKNIHLLGMHGVKVRSQKNGEMDYANLRTLIASQDDKPAIVMATCGTTMTEARDNIAIIKQILKSTPAHHIHVDAALAGTYTALLEPHHPFDFEDGADSISISGHKFIGSPVPSGVIIVRKDDKELLANATNYTGSPDSTISGSRSGHAPLFLWYAIQHWGTDGFRKRAIESQKMASYAHARLHQIGWKTWRNPGALTVMLASPPREQIIKWQLASVGGWSHIICMPGVTRPKIDTFIADLARP